MGAGGGFIIVPVLALLEPLWGTDVITGFSLAVVAANATAGSISYRRAGRVDARSALLFAAAAVPGSVGGALVTTFIPRNVFDPAFGIVLIFASVVLVARKPRSKERPVNEHETIRSLRDRDGNEYRWSFNLRAAVLASAGVGFLSSLLGIGGGIVHVPLLAVVFGFPEHIATATSHAVLSVTAVVGAFIHLLHGDYRSDWPLVLAAAGGAVAGAPLGARASRFVSGRVLLFLLALALAGAGARLLIARS